jgi:signal transduction histidine kinase
LVTGMSDMPSANGDLTAAKLARLAELENDFDGAVERVKLAALKEFAYGASHEINNPLANISTRAQALLAEEKHPEQRKKLATIVAQALRAHEMISDLMLFAKPPPLDLADVRVADLIATIVAECRTDAGDQKTDVSTSIEPPSLVLRGDGAQLGAALKALVRNALEALGEGGTIQIDATNNAEQTILSVTDNGPGIPPHVREHIFDPFYSGRDAGRGLGFGLPKCWRIAVLHGGRIEVESALGAGTTFRLLLPRDQTFSPR